MNRSLGLLLIRVAIGLVFIMHGWTKVNNLGMIEGMFVGFGLPAWTATFIAYLELVGGAALILGVLTRLFGLLLGIEMLVAIYLTGIGTGYKPHELEILLMLVSFGIAFVGSGHYSLWKKECHRCGGMMCDGKKTCPTRIGS